MSSNSRISLFCNRVSIRNLSESHDIKIASYGKQEIRPGFNLVDLSIFNQFDFLFAVIFKNKIIPCDRVNHNDKLRLGLIRNIFAVRFHEAR